MTETLDDQCPSSSTYKTGLRNLTEEGSDVKDEYCSRRPIFVTTSKNIDFARDMILERIGLKPIAEALHISYTSRLGYEKASGQKDSEMFQCLSEAF